MSSIFDSRLFLGNPRRERVGILGKKKKKQKKQTTKKKNQKKKCPKHILNFSIFLVLPNWEKKKNKTLPNKNFLI